MKRGVSRGGLRLGGRFRGAASGQGRWDVFASEAHFRSPRRAGAAERHGLRRLEVPRRLATARGAAPGRVRDHRRGQAAEGGAGRDIHAEPSAPAMIRMRNCTNCCKITPCKHTASRRPSRLAEPSLYVGYLSLMAHRWRSSSWSRRSRDRRHTPFVVLPTASTSRQNLLYPRKIGRRSGDRARHARLGLVSPRRTAAPARRCGADRTGGGDRHRRERHLVLGNREARGARPARAATSGGRVACYRVELPRDGARTDHASHRGRVNTTPGDFHSDPADQLIVATARVLNCALFTADHKIRRYSHATIYAIA